jgi:hopanoid biosynthesis associated radical SAM protein HpnH
MALPISINLTIACHLAGTRLSHLLAGQNHNSHIPLVLMLELTHACNLSCAGCGRIREYADTRASRLTRDQARSAMLEAGTPVVSISGGEPLLHPDVAVIAGDALALGKVVYLCTNAWLLAKRLPEFRPHPRLYFNVHLDGAPDFHDRLTGTPGTAERALSGIQAAKAAGFGVTTNTTLYHDTDMQGVAALFDRLTAMDVDGLMIAPAFAYQVGTQAQVLTRREAHQRLGELYQAWGDRNLYHTPPYMQFLRGERELTCMPWGTVTYNPQGWKRPCYLLTDAHVASFGELMNETDWDAYGSGRDPRCENCMLHSGFEPAVMSSLRGPRDWWHMIRWQLGR